MASLEPKFTRFLFKDTRMAWFWLVVRVYVGWEWLTAGWEKINSPMWVGSNAGSAVQGFLNGALQKSSGAHADVQAWYAYFIQHVALQHLTIFSNLVAWGEVLVGIALIVGFATGKAAFWAVFMNANYLLAGTVSTNPQLMILGILLMASWRISGWYGLDRFIFPSLARKFRFFLVSTA